MTIPTKPPPPPQSLPNLAGGGEGRVTWSGYPHPLPSLDQTQPGGGAGRVNWSVPPLSFQDQYRTYPIPYRQDQDRAYPAPPPFGQTKTPVKTLPSLILRTWSVTSLTATAVFCLSLTRWPHHTIHSFTFRAYLVADRRTHSYHMFIYAVSYKKY